MSEEIFDLNEFMERVQDDKELLLELIGIYLEDYVGKRKGLEVAVETKNAEEVRNIAHSLKGSSGNISAKTLRELFWKLEDMGKNGNLSQAKDVLSKVDLAFADFSKRITNLKSELGL
ncbi:MAG: Hpt domain-containing protein [Candidatus Omnitrophica bacterium]|nr:Hpt domain-containing protein [Candidatus Omnitrophota bacterium]